MTSSEKSLLQTAKLLNKVWLICRRQGGASEKLLLWGFFQLWREKRQTRKRIYPQKGWYIDTVLPNDCVFLENPCYLLLPQPNVSGNKNGVRTRKRAAQMKVAFLSLQTRTKDQWKAILLLLSHFVFITTPHALGQSHNFVTSNSTVVLFCFFLILDMIEW